MYVRPVVQQFRIQYVRPVVEHGMNQQRKPGQIQEFS
jgi:hypothetical protein